MKPMTCFDCMDSPVGDITIVVEGDAVAGIHIEGDRNFTAMPIDWVRQSDHPMIKQAKQEIAEYFAGKRKIFDFPVHFSGTPMQSAVWTALRQIPFGHTVTYKELAALAGMPRAVRAVATAVGRNKLGLACPCHRVIASDGSLGGYASGVDKKRMLLELEGINLA